MAEITVPTHQQWNARSPCNLIGIRVFAHQIRGVGAYRQQDGSHGRRHLIMSVEQLPGQGTELSNLWSDIFGSGWCADARKMADPVVTHQFPPLRGSQGTLVQVVATPPGGSIAQAASPQGRIRN
eukprot:gene16318-biopygen20266